MYETNLPTPIVARTVREKYGRDIPMTSIGMGKQRIVVAEHQVERLFSRKHYTTTEPSAEDDEEHSGDEDGFVSPVRRVHFKQAARPPSRASSRMRK